MNERRILEALYKGHFMTEMKRFDPSVFNQFKIEYGYYLDELSEEERIIEFRSFHLYKWTKVVCFFIEKPSIQSFIKEKYDEEKS